MKKTSVTVKELDVQTISDEDLEQFTVAGGTSDVIYCTCNSRVIYCYDIAVDA